MGQRAKDGGEVRRHAARAQLTEDVVDRPVVAGALGERLAHRIANVAWPCHGAASVRDLQTTCKTRPPASAHRDPCSSSVGPRTPIVGDQLSYPRITRRPKRPAALAAAAVFVGALALAAPAGAVTCANLQTAINGVANGGTVTVNQGTCTGMSFTLPSHAPGFAYTIQGAGGGGLPDTARAPAYAGKPAR